jgi:hypothetical protein
LLKAGHTQEDTARIATVSLRTVQRVLEKQTVQHLGKRVANPTRVGSGIRRAERG